MLLDTDILIDILRKHPPALAWFAALSVIPPISGFTAMELMYGCRNTAESRKVKKFLSAFDILWPDDGDKNRALFDYAPLKLSHNLSAFDALIAATAVGRNLELATFNIKHFGAVPGLTLIKPYVR